MVVDFSKSGFLYFIQQGDKDIFKIGIARHNPLKRLTQLQTGCSDKLKIVGIEHSLDVRHAERITHRIFSARRIQNEWFDCSLAEIVDYLKKSTNIWLFPVSNDSVTYYDKLLRMKMQEVVPDQKVSTEINMSFDALRNYTSLALFLQSQDKKLYDIIGSVKHSSKTPTEKALTTLYKAILSDLSDCYVYYGSATGAQRMLFLRDNSEIEKMNAILESKLTEEEHDIWEFVAVNFQALRLESEDREKPYYRVYEFEEDFSQSEEVSEQTELRIESTDGVTEIVKVGV